MNTVKQINRSFNPINQPMLPVFAIIISFLPCLLIFPIYKTPGAILGVAILSMSILLTLLRPKYFVYISLLLWPLRGLIVPGARFTIGSLISFDLNGFINILIIALGVVYLLIKYKNPFSGALAASYIIFLLFCALSLIYSKYLYGGIRYLARITSPFMFYLIAFSETRSEEDSGNIIRCILLSSIFPLSAGIFQLISGQGNTATEGLVRIYGTFEHPNAYSFFLVFIFCISFTVLLTNKSRWKIPAYFLLNTLIAALVIQTYCRISWLAFIAVFFFISYRYRKRKLVVILFLLMIIAIAFFSTSVFERIRAASVMNNIFSFIMSLNPSGSKPLLIGNSIFETGNSLGWRLNAWVYLLRQMAGHLAAGHGLGTVYAAMNNLYREYIHPHNVYLGVLYDAGLAGLSLFMIFIIFLFRKAVGIIHDIKKGWSAYKYASILLACLISFIIISTSDNLFENPVVSIYFWVALAMENSIYQTTNKTDNA